MAPRGMDRLVKFACESCQTKYTIPDEKVRGKVLKIRCKKCGSVITVKEEVAAAPEAEEHTRVADIGMLEKLRHAEAPPAEEHTRVADIGMLEKLRQSEDARHGAAPAMPARAPEAEAPPVEWFAMLGGEQVGPLSPADLSARIAAHEITDRTHIWRDGMADWKRASEVPELAAEFAPEPPKAAPPKAPPAPSRAPAGANYGADDNLPTVARPKPDLDALFGESEAAPQATQPAGGLGGVTFDDAPPARNGAQGNRARPQPSNNLADLMGDLGADDDDGMERTGAGPLVAPGKDPFSGIPDAPQLAQPAIGEQTRFFMKKAGVTNRNPWWKYAIFVLCIPGVLGAALYGLGRSGYGGTVLAYDAQTGKQVAVQRFSLENIKSNGLAALLTGAGKPVAAPVPHHDPPQVKKTSVEKKLIDPNAGDPKANLSADEEKKLKANLALLAGDDGPTSSGPKERKDTKTAATDTGSDGLSSEVVAKIVGENTASLNKCVEDKLKRDPSWKGGRVNVSVKIGPSGTVLDSTIDKRNVSDSDVGDCLKGRIKRMRFPRFSGEEPQEVQFPLLLTNGG